MFDVRHLTMEYIGELTFVVFIGEAGAMRLEEPDGSGWDKLAVSGSLSIRIWMLLSEDTVYEGNDFVEL